MATVFIGWKGPGLPPRSWNFGGDDWPRYVHCDHAECPIEWDHWHWTNEDGTAASSDPNGA